MSNQESIQEECKAAAVRMVDLCMKRVEKEVRRERERCVKIARSFIGANPDRDATANAIAYMIERGSEPPVKEAEKQGPVKKANQ